MAKQAMREKGCVHYEIISIIGAVSWCIERGGNLRLH
jgi:hypothetical protein